MLSGPWLCSGPWALAPRDSLETHPPPNLTFGKTGGRSGASWQLRRTARTETSLRVWVLWALGKGIQPGAASSPILEPCLPCLIPLTQALRDGSVSDGYGGDYSAWLLQVPPVSCGSSEAAMPSSRAENTKLPPVVRDLYEKVK